MGYAKQVTAREARKITLAKPFAYPAAATLIEDAVARAMHRKLKGKEPLRLPSVHPSNQHDISISSIRRGHEILHHMQDGRERTANDVAIKIGCSTFSIAEQMKRLAMGGYLVKHEVAKSGGPAFRLYRLP